MSFSDHFSIANIPYGIGTSHGRSERAVVTRLHDKVFFLDELELQCSEDVRATFQQTTLNALGALPKSELRELRKGLQARLSDSAVVAEHGIAADQVQMHMPVEVKGFTDFSSSKEHLLNAGEATFGERYMPPGALHFPIGYSGRPSSVVVSGTPIARPYGQYYEGSRVVFGPSRALDFELEMACVVGKPSKLGERVALKDADEHIFGLVLMNDWSARDILKLELRPLGPLSSKSFGTSISPWVITLEALEPFAAAPPARDFPVASYLQDDKEASSYDLTLEAEILCKGTATKMCTSKLKWMYWTFRDLVVQQTVNGCNIQTGDLMASGTVSGVGDDEHGCLLEVTMGGKRDFQLSDGERRTYLEDGDEVRLTASAGPGVGFGECTGVLVPAHPFP